ncbi:D-arabinitol 4-dehydrogenase [Pseudomonas oryzihabitans]|uniref:D-arabinitol 4-dehydrogenase n=1 Tax=Pseudomonas oryzihabitans TaxID=47885 RepID=UPI002894C1F3|nr:D-arabinitol 4-dehydrogenase [Pseudomonas oryzihabitans]MDT3723241.1 mannitol dehydrogenase family protein [Pseudomonas oryzihabitans]
MNRLVPEKSIWLHLGAGAFHRAHQAWYLNLLKNAGHCEWGLSLANIRNSATQLTLQQLARQQGRYTLEIISPEGDKQYQTITVVDQVILWDELLRTLIAQGANPRTKIISFTVTEGGYFLKEDGHLDVEHHAILADLSERGESSTLYGALCKILRARMLSGGEPVTLLSCDNLRNNGSSFYRGLLDFVAAKNDLPLLNWIQQNTSAPNSMVDRITPKINTAIHARLTDDGIHDDQVPVSCEAFSQWVLEDDFIAGRPPLENVGVEFVSSVTPYEEAKIRVLNASHSGVAWAGALLGKQYIDESLLPQVKTWIRSYVSEDVKPALQPTEIDVDYYSATILKRFSNTWIRDTNQRVSSDSIAKLHEFIIPTLKARYQMGHTPKATLILPALWFRFMHKRHQGQLAFEYQDRALNSVDFNTIFTSNDPLSAFARTKKIFGGISDQPTFVDDLRHALARVDVAMASMQGEP